MPAAPPAALHPPRAPQPQIATTTIQTLAADGGAVQPSDLDSLLDLAAVAAPALAGTPADASTRRRLAQATVSPTERAAALDALTRSFSVADGAQAALLAGMVGAGWR